MGTGGWRRSAEDAWRFLGVGLLLVGTFLLAMRLQVVLLPLFAGGLIAIFVTPVAGRLDRQGVPHGLAALVAVFGLVLGILAIVVGVVAFTVGDADHLGDQLSESGDRFARWLSEGPLDLDERDIEESRENLGDEASDAFSRWARGGGLLESTITALEVVGGAILTVVVAFFFVKDRERLGNWTVGLLASDRRAKAKATGEAAIEALRGYMWGCLFLGLVEGVAIGTAVGILGSPTSGMAVGLFTLVAAFVPIVGAIVAGLLAVAVTLAEGGLVAAIVVAVIALAVQQLDNDLLAPVILGRTTQLHPLAVLVGVTTG